MAKDEKKPTEQTVPTEQTPETPQTTIRWDGSKMRNTYANVCNVSSTREEVTLMFGINQNWHAGQKELTIELSDRMTLNPYAAKRMAVLLMNTMQEYENRFGEIELEAPENKAG